MSEKKILTIEEALSYLLMRDSKLVSHLQLAARTGMKYTDVLMKRIAETLTKEMKKSVVQTVEREAYLRNLIKLQHRMLKRFNTNLTELEDHVARLNDQGNWNKICDEQGRPDLKGIYV